MKHLRAITLFILLFTNLAQAKFYTHLSVQESKLCIQSQRRSKCSNDDLTEQQQKDFTKKIQDLEKLFPQSMMGPILNHFWANHAEFSYSLLMSQFDQLPTQSCQKQIQFFDQQKEIIQQKRQALQRSEKLNEKNLVKSCINSRTARKMYKTL